MAHYVGHAVAGCASQVASGGKCGVGAAAAVAGLAAGYALDGDATFGATQDKSVNANRHMAIQLAGGLTAAAVGGWKQFKSGTQTASYGYLYNESALKNSNPLHFKR